MGSHAPLRMIRLVKPHFGLNNDADDGTNLLRSCPDLLLTPYIKKHKGKDMEHIWEIYMEDIRDIYGIAINIYDIK